MATSRPTKDPWTRALRAFVNGSVRPHPLDPPTARLSLADAWSALRGMMGQVASLRRDYDGDAIWVERCRRVEEELASESPPTSLDHGVELAREHVVAIIDRTLLQPKERPYLHALAALRVHVGGPSFVADYLTRRTDVTQQPSHAGAEGYTLVLASTQEGEVCSDPLLFAPIAELCAVRRHLFASPEAEIERGAAVVAERVPSFAKGRWDLARNAVFAFGRDRTLAVPWLRAGLSVPVPAEHRYRTKSLDEAFVDPEMLSCIDDGALAEALVHHWLERDKNPESCVDHLADLVDATGSKAIPALDRLATADMKVALRKRVAALRAVAAAL